MAKDVFAGSNQIAHIVDCVLFLESDDESPLKFLRARKNRFGDTTEVGVFQHSETGLEEVADPSGVFLESEETEISGAARSFTSEGIRQIPIEVQALVTQSNLPTPRKQFNGVNHQRGQIVCAILDKFCKARLFENDVFVSTVSGIKVFDPQADLAIAVAILSSLRKKDLPTDIVFIGELSLTGHVRGALMLESKIKEAERLGFTKAVVPYTSYKNVSRKFSKIKVEPIKSIQDLSKYI